MIFLLFVRATPGTPGSHAPHGNPSWMRCIQFKINQQSAFIGQEMQRILHCIPMRRMGTRI
jgi:hypothetical protein